MSGVTLPLKAEKWDAAGNGMLQVGECSVMMQPSKSIGIFKPLAYWHIYTLQVGLLGHFCSCPIASGDTSRQDL